MKGLASSLALLTALAIGIIAGAAARTSSASSAATQSTFGPSVLVVLSNSHTGKRPVALTVTLGYEMQCGYPGSGSLVVGLPANEQLPKSFPPASATLDGKSVRVAFTSGNALSVKLPPKPQVMCDVIGPGTLSLVLTKAANLGNPREPGRYAVSAHVDGRSFRTSVRITT